MRTWRPVRIAAVLVTVFVVCGGTVPAWAGECQWCVERYWRFWCEEAPEGRAGHTGCERRNRGPDPCRMSGDACTGSAAGGDGMSSDPVKDPFHVEQWEGDLYDPCSDFFCPAECASCVR